MPIVFMISTRNAQHFISGPQPGLTGNKLGSEIMNRNGMMNNKRGPLNQTVRTLYQCGHLSLQTFYRWQIYKLLRATIYYLRLSTATDLW